MNSGSTTNSSAGFEPRKSWVLVGPDDRVIHLSDNRKMLVAMLAKGDRIERAQIVPLTETFHAPCSENREPLADRDSSLLVAPGERPADKPAI